MRLARLWLDGRDYQEAPDSMRLIRLTASVRFSVELANEMRT